MRVDVFVEVIFLVEMEAQQSGAIQNQHATRQEVHDPGVHFLGEILLDEDLLSAFLVKEVLFQTFLIIAGSEDIVLRMGLIRKDWPAKRTMAK